MCGFGETSSPFDSANVAGTNTSGFGLFGRPTTSNNCTGSPFAQARPAQSGTGLFGNNNTQYQRSTNGLFGSTTSSGGFGFGNPTTTTSNSMSNTTGGLFGQSQQIRPAGGQNVFGNNNQTQCQPQTVGPFSANNGSSGLFGIAKPNNGNLFGNNPSHHQSGGLFGGNRDNVNNTQSGGPFSNSTRTNGGLFEHNSSCNSQHGGLPVTRNGTDQGVKSCACGSDVKEIQPYQEPESSGKVIYQHLCFVEPYNHHSTEELRLLEYDNGRHLSLPFISRSTLIGGTPGLPDGVFSAVQTVEPSADHATCYAKIASRDAEIRLLKAKVIILEDQLHKANDKPQFGKIGLDRPPFSLYSTVKDGPCKGDPNIPINPDPFTNNSGRDFRTSEVKSIFESSTKTNSGFQVPDKDIKIVKETRNIFAAPPADDFKFLDKHRETTKTSQNIQPADKISKQPTSDIMGEEFESQNKRMLDIESQLAKVTALLEKISVPATESTVQTVKETTPSKEKGEARANEGEQLDSGASTPGILIYTPETTRASTSAGESEDYENPASESSFPASVAAPISADSEHLIITGSAKTRHSLSKIANADLTDAELRVLIVLKINENGMHARQIVASTALDKTIVYYVMKSLMAKELIAEENDTGIYKALV